MLRARLVTRRPRTEAAVTGKGARRPSKGPLLDLARGNAALGKRARRGLLAAVLDTAKRGVLPLANREMSTQGLGKLSRGAASLLVLHAADVAIPSRDGI